MHAINEHLWEQNNNTSHAGDFEEADPQATDRELLYTTGYE